MEEIKSILKNIFSLYLYSNLHIALCVGLFTMQSFKLFNSVIEWNYAIFTAFSTTLLYSLHRLIGVDLVGKYKFEGRFGFVFKIRFHLLLLAIIAAAFTGIFFVKQEFSIRVNLILPGILAAFYVLPVIGGRRLRDMPLIKIFIISVVYSYVCAFIPGLISGLGVYNPLILFFARFFFIFGITIPFDIRDLSVDKETNVKTLVNFLGIENSKRLAVFLLLISLLLSLTHILLSEAILAYVFSELFVHILCIYFVINAKADGKDFYYTFMMDGTMALFYFIGMVFN